MTFEAPDYASATPLSPAPANVATNRPFDGQDGWSRSTSSATGALVATPTNGEYAGGQAIGGATYIGAKSGVALLDPATRAFTVDVSAGGGEMGCGFWNDDNGDGLFSQSEVQFQVGLVASGSLQFGIRYKNFGTRVGSGVSGASGHWYRLRTHIGEADDSGARTVTLRVRDLSDGRELDFDPATAGIQPWVQTVSAANFGAAPEAGSGAFIRVSQSGSNGLLDNIHPGGTLPEPVEPPDPVLPAGSVQVAASGIWTWFNDRQAIVLPSGRHLVGYVRADGNVAVTSFDPSGGAGSEAVLSGTGAVQVDDHNNPSFTRLPDGKILAVYSMHSSQSKFYHRTSLNDDPRTAADWGPQQEKAVPSSISYSNTFHLGDEGTTYNFSRCLNYNPTVTRSTDDGATWDTPVHFIRTGTGNTRPYFRLDSDDSSRIGMIYTDAHPDSSPTSIYHLFYEGGNVRRTDGALIRAFADLPVLHDSGERGSVVYPYTTTAWGPGQGPDDWIPNGRAWTWDLQADAAGNPVCVFSVHLTNAAGTGYPNDRIYYYYARWTGTAWQRRFIAQAGRNLYNGQPNYAGGICVDPDDTNVVYISTNALDPFALGSLTDVPLKPASRYELYRGVTTDGGLTFTWTPLTENSAADNLRPVVPPRHGRKRTLLWFQGLYNSYTSYSTRVYGLFGPVLDSYEAWAEDHGLTADSQDEDGDHDGLKNLLEYALGTSPTEGTNAGLPSPTGDRGLRFHLAPRHPGAEVIVEASTDLQEWQSLATFVSGQEPSIDAPDVSVSPGESGEWKVLPEGGERRFFRLRAVAR